MDKNQVAYELAMMFAQEHLRRLSDESFKNFQESAPSVRGTFAMVYEVLTGSLPEER